MTQPASADAIAPRPSLADAKLAALTDALARPFNQPSQVSLPMSATPLLSSALRRELPSGGDADFVECAQALERDPVGLERLLAQATTTQWHKPELMRSVVELVKRQMHALDQWAADAIDALRAHEQGGAPSEAPSETDPPKKPTLHVEPALAALEGALVLGRNLKPRPSQQQTLQSLFGALLGRVAEAQTGALVSALRPFEAPPPDATHLQLLDPGWRIGTTPLEPLQNASALADRLAPLYERSNEQPPPAFERARVAASEALTLAPRARAYAAQLRDRCRAIAQPPPEAWPAALGVAGLISLIEGAYECGRAPLERQQGELQQALSRAHESVEEQLRREARLAATNASIASHAALQERVQKTQLDRAEMRISQLEAELEEARARLCRAGADIQRMGNEGQQQRQWMDAFAVAITGSGSGTAPPPPPPLPPRRRGAAGGSAALGATRARDSGATLVRDDYGANRQSAVSMASRSSASSLEVADDDSLMISDSLRNSHRNSASGSLEMLRLC